MEIKKLVGLIAFFSFMLFSTEGMSQKACCSSSKADTEKKEACCSKASKSEKTSGCTPSNCRGAQTKFGEAKVISELRSSLIALKEEMEKSESPAFAERSYDIHGIVGESDDESLDIIVNEVKLIEDEFLQKLNYKAEIFELPENKAKQVKFLNHRIKEMKEVL